METASSLDAPSPFVVQTAPAHHFESQNSATARPRWTDEDGRARTSECRLSGARSAGTAANDASLRSIFAAVPRRWLLRPDHVGEKDRLHKHMVFGAIHPGPPNTGGTEEIMTTLRKATIKKSANKTKHQRAI